MINIVHTEIHSDDKREITAIEIKLKYFKKNEKGEKCERHLTGHQLLATASAAFYNTTFQSDVGEVLYISLDPKRSNDVVDMKVKLKKENGLEFENVSNFLVAFQKALDNTSIF